MRTMRTFRDSGSGLKMLKMPVMGGSQSGPPLRSGSFYAGGWAPGGEGDKVAYMALPLVAISLREATVAYMALPLVTISLGEPWGRLAPGRAEDHIY